MVGVTNGKERSQNSRDRNWYLTITTFSGVDPDATHYYGRIRSMACNHTIDVEQKRLGTTIGNTIRFDTEEGVIEEAKKWFERNGKIGEKLILGRMGQKRDTVLARKR